MKAMVNKHVLYVKERSEKLTSITAPHPVHKASVPKTVRQGDESRRLSDLWADLNARRDKRIALRQLALAVAMRAAENCRNAREKQQIARLFITLGQCQAREIIRRGHPHHIAWIETNFVHRERQF